MRPADVVVVGGGIIGSAVAYYAARHGMRVTLIDQPKRGRATSASAGGLWPLGESIGLGCGVIYHKAKVASGAAAPGLGGPAPLPKCFFDFSIRSNAMFPSLAEELREVSGMDIEWEKTSLVFVMFDDGDVAFARSVRELCPGGASTTTWLSPEELARSEPHVARD